MWRFCNSHRARIWTAISFYSPETCGGEGGDWQNIGWYPVDPGSCVVVYENDLGDLNPYWYYYAEADDGAKWSGDFPTFIKDPDAFNICNGFGTTALRRVGFRELDVGDNDEYTLTFVTSQTG
jgi:uncharacterized membrane protein